MRIERASTKAIKYACLHFHYAKAIPVNTLGYSVFNDSGEWCGVVLYGMGATPHIGSPFGLANGECIELVRVALNGKQTCTSQVVAMTLKQVKKDLPLCRLIVSFADMDQKHLGTIYQATNWIYTGATNVNAKSGFIIHGEKVHNKTIHGKMITIDGKRVHCPQTLEAVRKFIDPNATAFISEGKRKYLMPLDKRMRAQILPLSKPYPKNDENWQKIDRTQFVKQDDGTKPDAETIQ